MGANGILNECALLTCAPPCHRLNHGNGRPCPLPIQMWAVCAEGIHHSLLLPDDGRTVDTVPLQRPLPSLANLPPPLAYVSLLIFQATSVSSEHTAQPNPSFSVHVSVVSSFPTAPVKTIPKLCRSQHILILLF